VARCLTGGVTRVPTLEVAVSLVRPMGCHRDRGAQGARTFCKASGTDFDYLNAQFPHMKFREGVLAGFADARPDQLYRELLGSRRRSAIAL